MDERRRSRFGGGAAVPDRVPFQRFIGPTPSGLPSGSPPIQAIRSSLEWLLDTPDDKAMSVRVAALGQAVLAKAARTPNEWTDLAQTGVRSDLVSAVIAAAGAESQLPVFLHGNLTFESSGTRVRFVRPDPSPSPA